MTFSRQVQHRAKTRTTNEFPSLTEQSHAKSCDIHVIMQKYEKTGVIDHVNQHEGTYMDYPNPVDFHTAQNIIAEAHSMFETVPARIRDDFDNDASQFLAFMQNPENATKIAEYGLSNSHLPETPSEAPSDKKPKNPNPTPNPTPKTPLEANPDA